MNLVMMTNTYRPHVGGVARSVESFAEYFREQGHPTLVVAPTFEGVDPERERDVIRVPAIQNFNGSDFSVSLPAPHKLRKRLDGFAPALIHTHHPFLLGDTAVRSARRLQIPLVFTHHTLYERYTHYVPLDSPLMESLAVELSTHFANLCSLVIAPSRSIADLIRERGVTRRIEVVPTGVDTAFFGRGDGPRARREYGLSDTAEVVGHVGRLAPEKNLSFIARALTSMLKEDPELQALLVGSGPEEDSMRALFEEAGIRDRVFWTGALQGDDLADAYAAMDAFAFASHTETQGMVLAEALAAGVPVCALDAPGARDIVRDGTNGRLLPETATPSDMARALRELLSGSRDDWAQTARESAAPYDKAECAARLLRLYGQLDSGPPPSEDSREALENILRRIEAEWDLIAQKARSLGESLGFSPAT